MTLNQLSTTTDLCLKLCDQWLVDEAEVTSGHTEQQRLVRLQNTQDTVCVRHAPCSKGFVSCRHGGGGCFNVVANKVRIGEHHTKHFSAGLTRSS